MKEPLELVEARGLIRRIVSGGAVRISKHALHRGDERDFDESDLYNALRGGWVEQVDFENGSWRYQVHTAEVVVVVAFRSETVLSVITAWRKP